MCTTTMRSGSFMLLVAAGLILRQANGAAPTEVSLSLAKTTAYASVDNIHLYQKQILEVTAQFPAGLTEAVTIELIPSIKPTIFALGDIVSHNVGSNLAVGTANWYNDVTKYPGDEYTDNNLSVAYNTRAVFSLGSVTNTIGSTDAVQSSITIQFEVVFVSMGDKSDGAEFWTSVGMEYSNGQYIWISQISFTLKNAETGISTSPSCTLTTPPATMTLTEKLNLVLQINLPIPTAAVTVEASIMSGGTELFVPKLQMDTVGMGFGYSVLPVKSFKENFAACPHPTMLSHELGTLINKEYASSTAASHLVKVNVTLQAAQLAAVSKQYRIGLGVDVNNADIFVTDFYINVTSGSSPQITTFTATADGSTTVDKGQIGRAYVDITIPEDSGQTVTLTLATSPATGNAAFSILSVGAVTQGDNVNCPTLEGTLVRSKTVPTSTIYDRATYTFEARNLGWTAAGAADNEIRLLVIAFMATDAVQGENHDLSVQVDSLTAQTVQYTAGTDSPYPTSVAYTFSLDTSCSSSSAIEYDVGSLFAFKVSMVTVRDLMAGGPMTLEASIPADLNNSNIHFKSASVISKGKNVVCLQEGALTPTLSGWNGVSTETDRAVQTFEVMCNFQVVDNTTEDVAVIEIVVYVKDNEATLLQTPANETFGVGIKFSGTQIWVASAVFTLNGPIIGNEPTFVTGVLIPAGAIADHTAFPGDLTLQWSADGLTYRDSPFAWKSPGENQTSSWLYTLEKPILTKYLRLVNMKTAGCRVSYASNNESVGQNITFYGNATSNHLLQQRLMLAMDNDNDTCFNLPQRVHTETAPFVWLNMKTYHLGVDGTNAYNVHLIGHGLSCNTPNGPQVTKMMYPKTAVSDKRRMKCRNTGELMNGDVTTCTYSCACAGAAQCEDLGILMFHKDLTVTGNYTLCSIWATQ